jgi:hypothetical protein
MALECVFVQTDAHNQNVLSLANAMTSSSEENFMMQATGPKIACIGFFMILAMLCTMYYDRFIKARGSSAHELGVHSETYAGRY